MGCEYMTFPYGTSQDNKTEYIATPVACGWAGAVLDKVTGVLGQKQKAQNAQKRRKSKYS